MKPGGPAHNNLRVKVLLLTEDSAGDAHAALEAIIKKAFLLLVPTCQTQPARIRIEPPNEQARRVMNGNYWKAGKLQGTAQRGQDHLRTLDLVRTIVTTVLEEHPPGFVLFHFDGDCPWSDRDRAENIEKFNRYIQARVRAALKHHLNGDEVAIERALRRLCPVVPHWSIEAWLYQNLDEARRICTERGNPPELLALLQQWADNRAALDELDHPKRACPLGPHHNHRLAASRWPAGTVYALGQSFAASVNRLRDCEELIQALESTAG